MKLYINASRLDNIANWKARTDAKAVADASEKARKLEGMAERIRALKPRIQEILETANAAREAGIELGKKGMYSRGTDPDVFETEGIYHRVGVMPNWKLGRRGDKGYSYMGVENGGANGVYNFITDGVFVGGIHEDRYNKVTEYPDFEYDMNKFLNNFDDYETRFYNYIDNLTGGAN